MVATYVSANDRFDGSAINHPFVIDDLYINDGESHQAIVVAVSKVESPIWQGFQAWRGQTKTNGESGSKRRYYEWDNTHEDIEVYDSNGKHLGSMDPMTGTMTKGPVSGRKIDL